MVEVPPGECWSDRDCANGRACVFQKCQDITAQCSTRVQCEFGQDCVEGTCQAADSTSMVAFPVTFYDVKCESIICSVTFSVPNQVNSASGQRNQEDNKDGLDYQYLLQEINARFSPANIDFVNITDFQGERTDLYEVELTTEDIVIANPLPPNTEPDVTNEPTTESATTDS